MTAEEAPLLNEEDEAFLHRIATEGVPPDLPERPAPPLPARPQDLLEAGQTQGNNAQLVLMNDAQDIPIPDTPDTPDNVHPPADGENTEKPSGKGGAKRSKWSWLRRDSRDARRQATATGLMSAAEGLKAPEAQPNEDGQVSDPEAKKEEEEMSHVLEELNLAAVNNRVFSISTESKELLHKYVNGRLRRPDPNALTVPIDSRSFSRILLMVFRPRMGIWNPCSLTAKANSKRVTPSSLHGCKSWWSNYRQR